MALHASLLVIQAVAGPIEQSVLDSAKVFVLKGDLALERAAG